MWEVEPFYTVTILRAIRQYLHKKTVKYVYLLVMANIQDEYSQNDDRWVTRGKQFIFTVLFSVTGVSIIIIWPERW